MPTVFSHPAPVLALAALLGGRVSTRMLLFGILCAVLPDADVIGFRFGISYADAFGHRGFSHSLAFALLMGCAGFGVAPLFLAVHASWDSPSAFWPSQAISCWTQ